MTKADQLDKHIKISKDFVTVQIRKELSETKKDSIVDVDMMYWPLKR